MQGHTRVFQQIVHAQHHQNTQVLIKILYRNRMPRRQQRITTVLQHRIHRHEEKSGQSANPHHQRERHPNRANPNHADQRYTQKHPDWNHACGFAHRNIFRRQHRAERTTDTDKRLHIRRLLQILAQIQLRPIQHDKLHYRGHAPQQCGDRQRDLPQFIRPQHL